MTRKKLRADTDWHELWQDIMRKCSAVAFDETGHLKQWSVDEAKDYLQHSNPEYSQALIDLIELDAKDNVLDIGCGPGVLTLPFSKFTKTVTAVDSSPGMLEVLLENAKAQKLGNIVCVNKFWRDVRVGVDINWEYDVVISSNSISLLGIRERKINGKQSQDWNLVDAVTKMNQVGKRVYVTFRLSRDSFLEVFRLLGKEYTPHPNHIILYNVLYRMGIRPNLHFIALTSQRSDDSAVSKWIDMIARVDSEEKETILNYVAKNKRNFHYAHELWGVFWWRNTN
jgi:SAM-dependent methyltransferase